MSFGSWIDDEFSGTDFGDKRLNNRFIDIAKKFNVRPDETINKSLDEFSDKKGAYRLFSNNKFTSELIFKSHNASTIERLKNEQVALALHDSSFFSFNSKRSIKGLGNIGGKAGNEDTHGFISHYTLAVTPNDQPIGLLNMTSWSRAYESPWEKESDRWEEGFYEAEKQCRNITKLIHIADREADQFQLLYDSVEEKRNFIIRSKHDRILDNEDHYLKWHLDKKKVNHDCSLYHTRLKKDVDAEIKYGEIEFIDTCPRIKGLKSERKRVKLNIVEIKTKGLEKKDQLNWILLTNLPMRNYGDAFLVINYYSKRWHVENFFKVLKDGCCKVERASLRTFEKLEKYICFFSILSWKLYSLKHHAEENPEEDANEHFSDEEVLILKIKNNLPKNKPLTIREALRLIAKMGGFNGRKGDGEPGLLSLWRGIVRFEAQMELFYELKKSNFQF
jgi:hypothetical protein